MSKKVWAQHGRYGPAALASRLGVAIFALARGALRTRVRQPSLLELDDHLLRDIGLERSQVWAAEYVGLDTEQLRAAACGQLEAGGESGGGRER